MLTLSFMAPEVRARIGIREFLEDHRVKLMGAMLMRVLDAPRPGVAARVAAMPELAGLERKNGSPACKSP